MRNAFLCCTALLALVPATGITQGTKLPVQQAIEAQFPVSKPTADHKDIVTAGAVIDLLKDNLVMYGTDATVKSTGTYKNGKFEYGGLSKMVTSRFAHMGSGPQVSNRTFVAGEKFFLIGVEVHDDGAVLEFLSDPISDLRYKGYIKYPFSGSIPAPDVVLAQIKETIKAEPVDNKQGGDQTAQQSSAPAPPPEPAPAPMADIPPPPPPTDAPAAPPKTISLGQTKDQVAANFGPPTKVVKLGTKEIDYYTDMKVTFVNGKVSDVQ